MKMETKKEIFETHKKEYFLAKSKRKRKKQSEIISAIERVTGMVRKSIIRYFSRLQKRIVTKKETRGRSLYYTPDVTAALFDVWEAGGEVCGELLHPMVREIVFILCRDRMWKHSDEATSKLSAMGMGTMKQRVGLFLKVRRKGRGFSLTSPSHLKHIIPVFSGPWDKEKPGLLQTDTVGHCGSTLGGDFLYTLHMSDLATLWTAARAQWNKGQAATVLSMETILKKQVVAVHELHFDSGSEFINWHCKEFCALMNISMSRSRPYRKNDNMQIEERNGHIIRKYIGTLRLDCIQAVDALNHVYDVLNPYLNHFVASRRCIEKVKVGSKYVNKFEKVGKTPYQRVMENVYVTEEAKQKLKMEHEKLNPLVMKKEIEKRIAALYDIQKKHGTGTR